MAAERILVVGPSWVGDMVMAQSLFKLLHAEANTPEPPVIGVVGPPWSVPVVERMPEVAHAHALDVGHGVLGLGTRRRLARDLRNRYDRAIVLPATFKSALLPLWAKVPVRTGFRGEHRYGLINDMRPLDKGVLESTAQRYCALGPVEHTDDPVVRHPALDVNPANQRRCLEELGLKTDAPVVALCPGAAYGPSKRWPADHFSALAAELTKNGHHVWIIGSTGEKEAAEAIASAVPAAHNLCGRTSLVDAIDLLALATVTVSNDSGLMHVASAVGSHVVALYGSTPPWYAPPLTERSTVRYRALECSPCFERSCPLKHHDCLRGLAAESVLDDVRAVLESSTA